MKPCCLGLLLGALVAAEIPNGGRGIGWRNDGNGAFPDAVPPVGFSDQDGTGKFLRWKVETPNWSNASPIVVGDAVYVLSEPVAGSQPILQRLDLATGAEVWRLAIDHLDAVGIPDQGREAVRKDFAEICRFTGDVGEYVFGRERMEQLRTQDAQHPAVAAFDALVARRTFGTWQPGERKGMTGKVGLPAGIGPEGVDPAHGKDLWLKYNCFMPAWANLTYADKRSNWTWECIIAWLGATFATPVWDGERLFVLTGYNTVAAVSPMGEMLWQRAFPVPAWFYPRESWGYMMTSPVIAAGKLIVQSETCLRALDRVSGAVAWQAELPHILCGCNWVAGHATVICVEGVDCIVAPDGAIYRAVDGRQLITGLGGSTPQPVKGRTQNHMALSTPIGSRDGILYVNPNANLAKDGTGGSKAIRLRFAGADQLMAEELWTATNAKGGRHFLMGGYEAQAVLAAEHIFSCNGVCELATGSSVALPNWKGFSGHPGMAGAFLGNRWVFIGSGQGGQSDSGTGRFAFYDLTTQKLVVSALRGDPGQALELARKRWRAGGWPAFGWATPFFSGPAMIVRSYDHVWCFAAE